MDVALIDGTFWDGEELPGRDMSLIPHPTVSESLKRLGERDDVNDQTSLSTNHTNPCADPESNEAAKVTELGWRIAREGKPHRWRSGPLRSEFLFDDVRQMMVPLDGANR